MDEDPKFPPVLTVTLELAVPLWTAEFSGLSFEERKTMAEEAGEVIAHQGDTLQYGSGKLRFGHGATQAARHRARPNCTVSGCSCGGEGCSDQKCWCHTTGQPAYSAGEIFNFLARGLACLAYQPGGVTFAGLHWCTGHSECAASGQESPTSMGALSAMLQGRGAA